MGRRPPIPPENWRLHVACWLALLCVQAGIRLLPYGRFLQLASTASRPRRRSPRTPATVAGAVTRVSRFVPGARCLARAHVVGLLLRRAGVPARVHIGVRRGEGDAIQAHAWVESEGQLVLHDEGNAYQPLASF